jgi:hypothetical protein
MEPLVGVISGVVLRRNPEPAAAKSDDPINLPFDLVSSLRDTFIGANLISNFGVSGPSPTKVSFQSFGSGRLRKILIRL